MAETIYRDSNIVKIFAENVRGSLTEKDKLREANTKIQEQAKDLSPQNRYLIAQTIAFTVEELRQDTSDYLERIADFKTVGVNEKAEFKIRQPGIRAYIQAKAATPARSKVASKSFQVDTISVSARPMVNYVELQSGQTVMSDLIADATYQMEMAELGYVQQVLDAAATTWEAPYYGTGTGVVKSTLDPMITFWLRTGGVSLIGDIAVIEKLTALTGFTADATHKQYADSLLVEHNANGYIGRYNGADVVRLSNPYQYYTDTPVAPIDKLFIVPTSADPSMRPLKIIREGGIQSMEQTNIDDLTYEVRLDQFFGAAIVIGERPYMSVYEDSSL